MEKVLSGIYYDIGHPASYSTHVKLYNAAKEHLPELTLSQVKDWLTGQITYTLHKPVRRHFERNPIIVDCVNYQWEADLVEMQEFKNVNKGYNYILTVIDVMSKYAWAKPLKNKTGKELTKVYDIITNKAKPFYLRTDQGKEFLNKDFKILLEKKNIHHFTSKNHNIKCAVVERFNRTLKGYMYKYFTAKGTRIWYNILPKLLEKYNNTYHKTIKMTPLQATKTSCKELFKAIYGHNDRYSMNLSKKSKIALEDTVRVAYEKQPFDKSYYPNWTDVISKIGNIRNQLVKPIYKVNEQNLYPEQVQKVKENLFRIEKIIKKRSHKEIKQCYIKWVGYSNEYNSWINESDIEKL